MRLRSPSKSVYGIRTRLRTRVFIHQHSSNMLLRACLLILPFVIGTQAQEAPNIRVQSNAVLVPTLVKDAQGHLVYGLTQKDFAVDDDGVAQNIHLDDSAESEPASVVVAIQTGRRAWREFGRMRGVGPMLNSVLDQAQSQIALVEFDSHTNLVEDFTADQTRIDDDLKNL